MVDAKAGEELMKFRTPETKTMLEGESWRLATNGIPTAGNMERTIKETLGELIMQERWQQLFGITKEQRRATDWEVFTNTHEGQPDWKNKWMTKFNARIGAV